MNTRFVSARGFLVVALIAWAAPPAARAAAAHETAGNRSTGIASPAAGEAKGQESKGKSKKKDSGTRVEIGADGFEVKDADGDFKLRLGGRLQVDAAFHDQDTTTLGDGAEIRRARIYFKGTVFRKWGYKSQFELSDGDVSIKDMYLRYSTEGGTEVTVGNFKEPFSLEEQTSSKHITFLERALPVAAFAPSRALGVGISRGGDRASVAAGLFGEPISEINSGEDQGFGVAARVTWAPVQGKHRVFHLGAASEYREPRDGEEIRFDARPESSVTEKLVRTRSLDDVASTDRHGFELAFTVAKVSFQGEYILTRVRRSRRPEVDLSGWYAYLSWFPTGESRPYEADEGTFGRVKPRGKRGAWELALRFSSLDLDDAAGGQEDNVTLALNWYPNANLRLMANYVFVDSERRGKSDDPGILLIRAQIAF